MKSYPKKTNSDFEGVSVSDIQKNRLYDSKINKKF
jgi:hypothetical protein